MSDVDKIHEEKETLAVAVNIPGHEARTTTTLFTRTRKLLIERAGGRCLVCGRTAAEAGPLEAHHHPIERSFANMIDWKLVQKDCEAGRWGDGAQQFDWDKFDPVDPYSFVDDMTVNGMLICKEHHIGKDEGIHALPFPIWLAQRYGQEGYKFSDVEVIHHSQGEQHEC